MKRIQWVELFISKKQRSNNEDQVDFWKQSLFSVIAALLILIGAPIFLFGAYMFYYDGRPNLAVIQVVYYIVLVVVLCQKNLSIRFRAFFLTFVVYSVSLLLIFVTGPRGAGMLGVVYALLLGGLLLDRKTSLGIYGLNVVFFIIISILLYQGAFEKYLISEYIGTWYINMVTVQGCSLILILLFHFVFEGMENQNKKVSKSKDEITYLYERDHLTGLFNRQHMEEMVRHFNGKNEIPISLIYGDVNGLKMINDALGHEAGDKLLKAIADILRKSCRDQDLVFRIGGDEFLLILQNTSREHALMVMERIHQACQKYNEETYDEAYFLSISMGLSTKESTQELIEVKIQQAEEAMYKRKLLEEKSIHHSILMSMLKILFEKSQETEEHANRLVSYSIRMGQKLGLSQFQMDDLELAAKLHDIGKIGIDRQILEKVTPLTKNEWEELKKHPEIGYRIAKASGEIASIAELIYTHHERWDGKGYPRGLQGEEIPLEARIIAVADAYDAMTEDRIYRKAMTPEAAVSELLQNSGSQFDPRVVEIFMEFCYKE